MNRGRIVVAVLTAALLGALATTAVSPLLAQSRSQTTIVTTTDATIIHETEGGKTLLRSPDLALRIDHSEKGRVVGTLVAKVNGNWVPVELSSFNSLAR